MQCFKCGEEGHMKRNCPQASKPSDEKCFRCGEEGHFKRDCPQLRKFEAAESRSAAFPMSKVGFIDTHCHLEYLFDRIRHRGPLSTFISSSRSFPPNFQGCITVYCDPASYSSFGTWRDTLEEANVWAAFGMHPHNAKYYNDALEEKIIAALAHPRAVAWGETGLDYGKHSGSEREVQKVAFERQLKGAMATGKPVVIHCRDAEEDVLRIATETLPGDWKIHLHCYTGSSGDAQKFFRAFPNLFVGFTGVSTYDSAKVIHQCIREMPLERILLETDTPYMVPGQLKRNNKFSHPGMIPHVAQRIAELKGVSLDDVMTAARDNTTKIYGI